MLLLSDLSVFRAIKLFSAIFAMIQKDIIEAAILLLVCSLSSCTTIDVYQEQDKPIFHVNTIYADTLKHADSLGVISFNIEKSAKIEEAIAELKDFEKIKEIDIYLLQEMDEKSVDSIARKLNLNYLYIPIVRNNLLKKTWVMPFWPKAQYCILKN